MAGELRILAKGNISPYPDSISTTLTQEKFSKKPENRASNIDRTFRTQRKPGQSDTTPIKIKALLERIQIEQRAIVKMYAALQRLVFVQSQDKNFLSYSSSELKNSLTFLVQALNFLKARNHKNQKDLAIITEAIRGTNVNEIRRDSAEVSRTDHWLSNSTNKKFHQRAYLMALEKILFSPLNPPHSGNRSLILGERKTQNGPKKNNSLINFSKRIPEGTLVNSFGKLLKTGERSQGLSFKIKPGAYVFSPITGRVVFSGPFKDIEELLIIDYGEQYHLVLSGMARTDLKIGDRVSAGQKIGTMDPRDASPILYLEVRLDSKPINPVPWLVLR
jgi:murein DD-endopeptidase MepM/ murein hydrolase activator NlpD